MIVKKILFLTILYSFSSMHSFAQSAEEKEVAAAVEILRKVMIDADKATLESIAAEELSYGHSSGMIENKAAFIDEFVLKRSVFLTITLSDQTIKVVDNVAIVRHRLTGDSNNKNVPGKVDIIVLLIWQKQNGQWKLLARQAAKI